MNLLACRHTILDNVGAPLGKHYLEFSNFSREMVSDDPPPQRLQVWGLEQKDQMAYSHVHVFNWQPLQQSLSSKPHPSSSADTLINSHFGVESFVSLVLTMRRIQFCPQKNDLDQSLILDAFFITAGQQAQLVDTQRSPS